MSQLTTVIDHWVQLGQGLIASLGALALLAAFVWRMLATDPRAVSEARRWIGRIVVSVVGAELAVTLTQALIHTIPQGTH
jgi:hypothetical protein